MSILVEECAMSKLLVSPYLLKRPRSLAECCAECTTKLEARRREAGGQPGLYVRHGETVDPRRHETLLRVGDAARTVH